MLRELMVNCISSSKNFQHLNQTPFHSIYLLLVNTLKIYIYIYFIYLFGFPCSSVSKVSDHNAGDPGSISGFGRSPGKGNSSPLQYSCLENDMDREAWPATVYGVARGGHNQAHSTRSSSWRAGSLVEPRRIFFS